MIIIISVKRLSMWKKILSGIYKKQIVSYKAYSKQILLVIIVLDHKEIYIRKL